MVNICGERFDNNPNKPFSRVKGSNKKNSIIRLPKIAIPVYYHERGNYCVYKATISADPILNAKDCTVAVIYEGSLELAFPRLGKDTTWTYINWWMSKDVVQIEDKHYYCVDGYGELMAFDINKNIENIAPPADELLMRSCRQIYLVDSVEKELLKVHRYISYRELKHKTKFFKIYKLNFDDGKWIEKKTLGDVTLFIGDNSSIFVFATNFPGCRPNCIYFNHDNDRITSDNVPSHDYGVYNVGSEEISQPYTIDAKKHPPIWVVPPFEASQL